MSKVEGGMKIKISIVTLEDFMPAESSNYELEQAKVTIVSRVCYKPRLFYNRNDFDT